MSFIYNSAIAAAAVRSVKKCCQCTASYLFIYFILFNYNTASTAGRDGRTDDKANNDTHSRPPLKTEQHKSRTSTIKEHKMK